MQRLELFKYNPSKAALEELEKTFVGREKTVHEILNDLKKQATAKSNQHFLIKGPRGIGKTNTLLILSNRISENQKLSNTFLPLQFAEEEYSIVSLRDFFIKILEVLQTKMMDDEILQAYTNYSSKPDDETATENTISFLTNYTQKHNCKLLLLIDNLDLIFGNQIKQISAAQRLRDELLNNNFMVIIGTTAAYFKGAIEFNEQLYYLFKQYHLDEFDLTEMETLLIKRAKFDHNLELATHIPKYRNRLKALRHLTGGNPRLVLMLYQLLTLSELPEVKSTLNLLLDDLTPYYKHKLESLPPQARKIVDTLARMDQAASPTEISKQARIPVNQVSTILKRLFDDGYISPAKQAPRKATYYILSERLFRLWHQMRYAPGPQLRLPFLVEFISLWYSKKEVKQELRRLEQHCQTSVEAGKLHEALRDVEHTSYLADALPANKLKNEIFDSVIQHYIDLGQWDKAEKELQHCIKQNLAAKNNERVGFNYYGLGIVYYQRGLKNYTESHFITACEYYAKSFEYCTDFVNLYCGWGDALSDLAQIKKNETLFLQAFEKYEQAIKIKPDYHEALNNWANNLSYLARLTNEEALFRQAFDKFEKAVELQPDKYLPYYNWGNALGYLARLNNDEALFGETFSKYQQAVTIKSDYYEALYGWGYYLGYLAQMKNDESLFYEAFDKYRQTVTIKPDHYEAYYSWGYYLGHLARLKNSKDLFLQAIEKFDHAVTAKPDFHEAFYNWGNALSELARLNTDETLFQQAFDKYQQAVEIKPNYYEAFYGWGYYLGFLAQMKNDEILFQQAIEKLEHVVFIKPDHYEAFYNWGNDLGYLARLKNDESLFKEAFHKFQQAVTIKPDYVEAFYSWGYYLGELARIKNDQALYHQAFEKYQSAVSIKPDFYEAFYNWGIYLSRLARLKNDEAIFQQACEKFENAVIISPDYYEAFYNWGYAFCDLALLKKDNALFRKGFDKFEQALQIKQDYYDALNGMGIIKGRLGEFDQALIYFEKAYQLAIKADDHEAIWVSAGNTIQACGEVIVQQIRAQNIGEVRKLFNKFLSYMSTFKEQERHNFLLQFFNSFLSKHNVALYYELENMLREYGSGDELKLLFPISKVYEYWKSGEDAEVLDRLNPEVREVVEDILTKVEIDLKDKDA